MWLFITISKYRSDRRRVEIVIYNIVWYNTISWYFYLLELEITKSKSRGCICIFNLVPVVQHFDLFLLFNEIVRSRIWMDIQKPSIYCFTFYIKLLKWISHIYTTSVFYYFLLYYYNNAPVNFNSWSYCHEFANYNLLYLHIHTCTYGEIFE